MCVRVLNNVQTKCVLAHALSLTHRYTYMLSHSVMLLLSDPFSVVNS